MPELRDEGGLQGGRVGVGPRRPPCSSSAAGHGAGLDEGRGSHGPRELFKKYGVAYVFTSISLALVSFVVCYLAVRAGVDVPALLARVGLGRGPASQRFGTAAVAYALHKALAPVRFVPTLALTPVFARWLASRQRRRKGGQEAGSVADASDL